MIFQVTQRDIDRGLPRCPCYCPIACAIKKALLCPRQVSVSSYAIKFNGRQFTTPPEVRIFIRDFDTGKPVKPITFTLEYHKN